jgi:pimeloyl-ACP methyl ester carboxylesterase
MVSVTASDVRVPGGRNIRVAKSGSGSPAVIFEAGWGCWSEHWRPVQELAGEFTATYSYDRAGHGSSDPCDPWSLEGCIADLEAWLAAAQVPGLYLLVGHSYGGHIVRAFAAAHPADVMGLILVDAAHEDLDAAMPQAYREQLAELVADITEPLLHAKEVIRRLPGLRDLPLTVITHARADWIPDDFGLSQADRDQAEQLWQQYQGDLAAKSARSTFLVAGASGHMIQLDQPELVADEIHTMIRSYSRTT